MGSTLVKIAASALVGVIACSSGELRPSPIAPSGPPRIDTTVVDRHARQFDSELADRPAGSQREQGASQYLLGHLQRAGYPVRLEGVPVANLVRSTNLLGQPPRGETPIAIVACAYDGLPQQDDWGHTIGTFLELARALYVRDPEHRVEFAALGAERTEAHLGSRLLAQQLIDQERDPFVVTLAGLEAEASLSTAGARSAEARAIARDLGMDVAPGADVADLIGVDVFARAGFDHLVVTGSPDSVGAVLLELLGDGDE
ncbi:MAG: hypothetical protein M3280_11450 [Actinomycetota bacterium]|nr:hypothetical protein [Actinomycetota bacterium]